MYMNQNITFYFLRVHGYFKSKIKLAKNNLNFKTLIVLLKKIYKVLNTRKWRIYLAFLCIYVALLDFNTKVFLSLISQVFMFLV